MNSDEKLFSPDIENPEFLSSTILLKDDWQGNLKAILLKKLSESDSKIPVSVLYIHGFIDYFFQYEIANRLVESGVDFYALDLRKYGRSLMDHQKPNIIDDLSTYYEEIAKGIEIIKSNAINKKLILIGHSTGGLIASLFAKDHQKLIDGLILNSPFFQFNEPAWKLLVMIPLVRLLNKIAPELGLNSLSEVNPKSLHKDYFGEWNFNKKWKPIENFPAYIMWINAIRNGHNRIHKGLGLEIPVLVLCSDKSFRKKKYASNAQISDSVLDVNHIEFFSNQLSKKVEIVKIHNALHDVYLSIKPAREKAFSYTIDWIMANF